MMLMKKNADIYRINNSKTATSKSLDYETKIVRSPPNENNILETEVVVPFKDLSNV